MSSLEGSSLSSGVAVQVNTWYFVTLTYDDNELSIYINDDLKASATITVDENADGNFLIGVSKFINSMWFSGTIDEVKIYDRTLTAEEITLYSLSNLEAGVLYNSCSTVNVTWDVTGVAGTPNFINVEYLLTDGTSLEVVSYPFSPTVESDNSHSIVEGVETGQVTTVWIYFADDATDRYGDSGISNPIFTTYSSYIKIGRASCRERV